MTLPRTNDIHAIRRDIGKLFGTTLIVLLAAFLSLLWLWKVKLCAPNIVIPTFCVGIMGTGGYIGTLVILLRLKRRLRDNTLAPTVPSKEPGKP